MSPRRRPGLRARLTAAFALGALLLSAVLALSAYFFTRSYLLDQRETSGIRQATTNAATIADGLRDPSADVPALLEQLPNVIDARTFLYRSERDRPIGSSAGLGSEDLPLALRERVLAGESGVQRFREDGEPWLAVGVPLTGEAAAYIEVSQLEELDRTLRIISATLALAALATTVAGAGLGFFTSVRLLRPVRQVSAAAADIAGGRLGTRLPAATDPDLAPLVSSFNRMADTLQARLERDARFAADVSHELRSPLTTLVTASSVLEGRRAEMPERAGRAADLIIGELRRFEQLVEDLLDISVADRGGHSLVAEDIRLAELVRQSVHGGAVTVAEGAETAVVRGEKRRLERVFANLVDNARSHGGGLEQVCVSLRDGRARVEVDDRGPGVPVGDREKVFERFHRGAASGQRGSSKGTGLGLSLVAEHVAAHDGRVWVEDRPGGGARFVVELPLST